MSSGPLHVALVNDYDLVVAGLQAMLVPYRDRVTTTCTKGVPAQSVDIALYDCFAMGEPGWATLEELQASPRVDRLAVYTKALPQTHVARLAGLGVTGLLSKAAPAEELVAGLERIHDGESVVSPEFPVELARGWWPGRADGLTEREAEAVALVCRGLSNEAIAGQLHVSLNTLKSYIRSAYRTMGVTTRSEAVLWGVARGMHVDAGR